MSVQASRFRDVHYTHYGRLCPIESPEGPNIGLISSLCVYANINDLGFIVTPYRTVKDSKVEMDNKNVVYLTAEEEENKIIGQGNAPLTVDGSFIRSTVKMSSRCRLSSCSTRAC